MTSIAALRCGAITAPLVLDGPINGDSFLAWVEQALVTILKLGDVVVLDNLGSHKGNAVRRPSGGPRTICCSCRLTVLT